MKRRHTYFVSSFVQSNHENLLRSDTFYTRRKLKTSKDFKEMSEAIEKEDDTYKVVLLNVTYLGKSKESE